VGLIRQTFDWSQIETSPGQYSLGKYDSFVLACARNRISILPILFNAPKFHSRAPRSGAKRGAYPPRRNATFARFAATLARRYGPGGSLWSANRGVRPVPIRSWQIWNEPTLRVYWQPRQSARAYVRLLKAATKAIKKVNRRAEIVTAGLPPSLLRSAVPLARYIQQMYRVRGAKRAFDTLAINSYAKNTRDLKRLLTKIRKLMNKNRDRRARIWVTELGWATAGPRHRFRVGPRGQAKLIKSSIRFIRRNRRRLRLRGFVYFSWRDGRPYAPLFQDGWGLHTGLLALNGAQKPGFKAFKAAVRPLR
jgi:hypothetical protein